MSWDSGLKFSRIDITGGGLGGLNRRRTGDLAPSFRLGGTSCGIACLDLDSTKSDDGERWLSALATELSLVPSVLPTREVCTAAEAEAARSCLSVMSL